LTFYEDALLYRERRSGVAISPTAERLSVLDAANEVRTRIEGPFASAQSDWPGLIALDIEGLFPEWCNPQDGRPSAWPACDNPQQTSYCRRFRRDVLAMIPGLADDDYAAEAATIAPWFEGVVTRLFVSRIRLVQALAPCASVGLYGLPLGRSAYGPQERAQMDGMGDVLAAADFLAPCLYIDQPRPVDDVRAWARGVLAEARRLCPRVVPYLSPRHGGDGAYVSGQLMHAVLSQCEESGCEAAVLWEVVTAENVAESDEAFGAFAPLYGDRMA
jgi:hypothetical protein